MSLTGELGERLKTCEEVVAAYRDTSVALAARKGVDVPEFVRQQSNAREHVEQLRVWLATLMLGASAEQETGSVATPSNRRGRGDARSVSKRAKTRRGAVEADA